MPDSSVSLLSALAVVLVLFAGCVGEDAPAPTEQGTVEEAPVEAAATATTGSIRGSVTSDLFEPLPGAVVTMIETGLETKVARNGHFTINEVDPGTYQLLATRDGYTEVTRSVTVRAGEVSEAAIQLVPKAVDRSWNELIEQTGIVLSGYRYQAEVDDECQNVPTPVIDVTSCGGVTSSVNANIHPIITESVMTQLIEVHWESAGPLGEYLFLDHFCPDVVAAAGRSEAEHPCYTAADGQTSPLVIRLDQDTWDLARGNWTGEWTGRVYPGFGILGTYGLAGVDAGVTYQQSFTFYQSFFHLTKAPEGYSGLPDV